MLNLLDVFRAWRRGKPVLAEEKPQSAQIVVPAFTIDEIEKRKARVRRFGRGLASDSHDYSVLEQAIVETRERQLRAGRSGRKVSLRVVAQLAELGRSEQAQIRVRNLIAANGLGKPLTTSQFVPV